MPEEYLAQERVSAHRNEYLDGRKFEMAGESLLHSRIYINLVGEIGKQLRGKEYEPLSQNMKVRTACSSMFAYPDLTIVCNDPLFHDPEKDVLLNPRVIFEVLSPSTEKYDRTTKFARYRMGNETLTDYVLVSQDKPFVEHFSKQADGEWVYRSFNKMTNSFDIESVGCALTLAEIYDRVEFEPLKEPKH